MTKLNSLTQMHARNFGPGKYSDGQGLWLCKSRKEAGKWMLRLSIEGRRREMGLGRWPDVSIGEARQNAAEARRKLRDGVDPVAERQSRRSKNKRLTLAAAVDSCFQARRAELKGDGKAGRWLSPLTHHILPKLGATAVEDIDQHIIKEVLDPIWHEKAHTAQKALDRLNLTIRHAAALGLEVDMQAAMKARALLGKQKHTPKHIPSMPYAAVPDFYNWLCKQTPQSCLALRFLILTAARTSEVRLARFDEITGDIWVIPAERTKTGKEHRVPLAPEALSVVSTAKYLNSTDLLFPSVSGKPMSDAAMSRLMEREGHDTRPHGFRASFRTWVEEQTTTEYEVKETALGHKVDTGIVGAYQRSDRLDKRRILMEKWETFLLSF